MTLQLHVPGQALARLATAGLVALLALPLWASASQSSPPAPELLPALHAAFDGDQWIHNDGWLDEEVFFCDWYGVECVEITNVEPSYWQIEAIDLSGNNLRGEFTPELLDQLSTAEFKLLDLSNNLIQGTLDALPARRISAIRLADNLLEGLLPELNLDLPAGVKMDLTHLDLARNRFSGAIPNDWDALELTQLDLSDNLFDGGAQNAFAAMSRTHTGRLDLSGNHFSEALGSSIISARLSKRDPYNTSTGGLNLCFNDLTTTIPELVDWIAERHAGSPDWQACQGLDRQPITPAISGSWFDPERNGEGISLLLMENGAPLLYRFGFNARGQQQWLFEVGHAADVSLRWDTLYETAGFFSEGIAKFAWAEDAPYLRYSGRMRVDYLADGNLSVWQLIADVCDPWRPPFSPPGFPCVYTWFDGRAPFVQLTELTGAADCSVRNPMRRYSGAWFSPERSGEGFIVEIMDNNDALVYWFTYEPAAEHDEEQAAPQAWMMGVGTIESLPGVGDAAPVRLEVDLIQPVGGQGGYDFDSDLIELVDWGTLILWFDHDAGTATWSSDVPGYGAGEYEIERLARPMLANCD